jgi:transcriptional regulator with XRE-family HTH domain
MKRKELLKSKEYWMVQIQNDLFGAIEKYMKSKNINRTKLAETLGVSKGYITQILNGDFDHKLSKLVELSLASNAAPILNFTNLDKFIDDDANDKCYELMSLPRPKFVIFTKSDTGKKIIQPVTNTPSLEKVLFHSNSTKLTA